MCFYKGVFTMSHSEEREEACSFSNEDPFEENDNELKAPRSELENQRFTDFPLGFQRADQGNSPSPSVLSVKCGRSMDYPAKFKKNETRRFSMPITLSLQSDEFENVPVGSKRRSLSERDQQTSEGSTIQTNLDTIFMTLEKDTIKFMKNELKKIHGILDRGGLQNQEEETPHEQEKKRSKQAILNISLHFLRTMNQGELVDELLNSDFMMSQSEDSDETQLSSNDRLSEEHQTGSRRSAPDTPYNDSPSCVSIKSDKSMDYPLKFKQSAPDTVYSPSPSCVSMKSDKSMDYPLKFKQSAPDPVHNPSPSCVSMKSDKSMDYPLKFTQSEQKTVVVQRDKCVDYPVGLKRALVKTRSCPVDYPTDAKQSYSHHCRAHKRPNLDSVFQILEEIIVAFVKTELRNLYRLLNPEHFQTSNKKDQMINCDDEEKWSIKEAFVHLTLEFLKGMKQQKIAELLHNKCLMAKCHCKLKSNLRRKLAYISEGIAKERNPTLLNKIYTELYVTEGKPSEVSCKHEIKLIERAHSKPEKPEKPITCEDMFKPITGSDKPIRTVMTEGVAGIGKTVLTQKFALDWAESKIYQHIQFMFLVHFRDLNILKMKKISLVELIHLFFPETKEAEICNFEKFQVLFIFDGLDECRLPLNLKTNDNLTDATQHTSLDVILTNLIKGRLLPSAQVWITTRPAAAHQIPPEFVDLVTEVRGFNDPQKEEYFRKRFTEEEESRRIISHLKSSRSLHIMCHIPVFCWISATVLEDAFKTKTKGELPTSLTEMYVYFLVVLSKVKNVKYDEVAEANPLWTPQTRDMIQSLGKLAFEQLMKGNLFFYESDLMECGIDVSVASVYSGVFTEIFKEERGVFQDKVFCFVHLSIQEFLAALHVYLTFTNTGVNLLSEEKSTNMKSQMSRETLDLFYQSAVDKALKTPKGHLNLFLRFLLGLSLETNQTLLRGLVIDTTAGSGSNQNTIQYIKEKIAEIMCLSKKANLFQCLNELKDYCLVDEIQQTLRSSKLKTENLSPAQLTILVNIMLSSEENLELFDLRKYPVSQNVQLALLPLFIHSTKAVLSYLALTEMSYTLLVSGLQSPCGTLKDLDLSNNDLQDSGMKLLCEGLCDSNCKLETLSLSGCLITKEGCAVLESALKSNPSHLTELDLSYNHPEESGVKLLSAGLKDPNWALQTLKTEPAGAQFLNPGLNKYAYELIMDPSSAHRNLQLSDNNRKVAMGGKKQLHPDDPERSDVLEQLLCKDGLTGRCYWEVEWRGRVSIGVTYKGESDDCGVGMNKQSWTLLCSDDGLSVQHGNKITPIHGDPSNRLGLYLDWPGGIVSFFGVSLGKSTYLHSFTTKFTEPVYPAFGISTESSLSLC
ncbi:NACHT, LRR and PYD domains-containing protein 3-like isoform X2 [Poecilia reticulata]|uniref:NACHT, LRR and PYD domains-containing protein 3-like isoform X2 n=1 Tax=Poecilia reticulata TaxID=8081 RepID=UPI0007E9334B|nr:PREDICTED: NACHT, LRR and PYD domains-containing protein 3-like isoform X2 [Poecilia reticulata]